MFEYVNSKKKTNIRWTFWIGIVFIAGLISLTILAPKLWPQTIRHVAVLAKTPIVAPVPLRPTPPQPSAVVPPKVKSVRVFRPPVDVFYIPKALPPTLVIEVPEQEHQIVDVACCVAGLPDGTAFGNFGNQPFAPPAPPPQVRLAEPTKAVEPIPTQVRRSSGVLAANLIRQVAPQYPALAKNSRTQGTVLLSAVIGRDGTIQRLKAISGSPLLVQAAMEAVRQWVYRPTLLNGEPVEVVTEISVIFTLQ